MESKKPTGKKDHYFVIYNPHSGKRKKGDVENHISSFFFKKNLNSTLLKIGSVDLEEMIPFFRSTINARIVVIGGDGTLRSVYSLCYFNNIELPVAFVPLGSANVSARSFGTPLNFDKALSLAISGEIKKIDCGVINGKHLFTIAACFGKIAEITIDTKSEDKQKYGAVAYFKKSGTLLSKYSRRPFSLENGDDTVHFSTAHSVMVCNHFNVFRLSLKKRGVVADDGELDVLVATHPSIFGIIRAIFDFYFRKGDTSALKHHKIKNACIIGQDFDGKVHLDGETITLDDKNISMEIAHLSLNIII